MSNTEHAPREYWVTGSSSFGGPRKSPHRAVSHLASPRRHSKHTTFTTSFAISNFQIFKESSSSPAARFLSLSFSLACRAQLKQTSLFLLSLARSLASSSKYWFLHFFKIQTLPGKQLYKHFCFFNSITFRCVPPLFDTEAQNVYTVWHVNLIIYCASKKV